MSDFNLSLEIKQTGADQALAELTQLTKSGQAIVDRFSKATGASLDASLAKYRSLGDQAAMTMLRQAVAAENAAKGQGAAVDKVTAATDRHARAMALAEIQARKMDAAFDRGTIAIKHSTATHEPHIRGLSRIGNSLATLVGHATGVPPVIERIADAIGIMAFGHVATVGALAGFAAIAFAYEKITEKAREAAEQAEKTATRISAAAATAANAGKADDLNALAREALFGTPYVGEGKNRHLMAGSDLVKGAFSGSLADLKAQQQLLQQQIDNAPNLIRKSKLAQDMLRLQAALKPLQDNFDAIVTARDNLLSQPSDSAGKLSGITVTEASAGALAKRADREAQKVWDERVKEFARGVKDRQKALKEAVKGAVGTMTENDALRQGGVSDLIPSKQEFDAAMFEINRRLKESLDQDPFIGAKKALDAEVASLAAAVGKGLGDTLGSALAAGFTKAFSGGGVGGAIKALGGSILNGLGDLMISLGERFILFGKLMEGFILAVKTWNPFAQIAIGVAMIAAGAAMKAIASSFGGKTSGGGSSGGGGAAYTPTYLAFGVGAGGGSPPTTSQSAPAARGNNYFTLIGPDDPKVQRTIAAIVNGADARGLIRGAA